MKWIDATLGKLIDVKHGFAFKGEFFSDVGDYILLTPGNCYEKGGLKLKGEKELFYTGEFPREYLLSFGDLLIVMTDLVGTAPVLGGAFRIPEDNLFLQNQRLGLVKILDGQVTDKDFLYYLLNNQNYRGQIRGSASGATVRHTSPGRIKKCKVKIPAEKSTQQRIGEILSSYDNLIEINRRRIHLLEESARLLFREWFVYFRFPGHENVKIVDGMPKGWEKEKLIKIGYLNYGKALVEETREDGDVKVYGSSGVVGVHSKSLVEGPGIIVGRKGNVGAIHWVNDSYWPIDTVYYIKKEQSNLFLYLSLKIIGFINTDASVPGLNRDYAHNKTILVPTKDLLDKFLNQVNDIYSMVKILTTQNQKLAQARDLLLPRLMSGTIEV
jgi:type I restriction enzyme, S subunit